MSRILSANTTLSHYRIVSQIGVGGMGEVYLAEDTHLERQVALKVLLSEVAEDEDRVRRFVQEAKAASALNHPNILTVHEIGSFENSRFIATELIKGETLHERLSGEPLTLRETLDVTLQIASALNAAHSAGIVHRDIKPENVMLRDDGLVKVLDFGLAKLTEKKMDNLDSEGETRAHVKTSPGMVMGTVTYMSPEQARGKGVDARSDIWSLGVVVYEMLTNRTPFEGETTNDRIAAILTREPAPLGENTPAELQRIIRKALQKKADERYQTVKDFLLDVKNLKRQLEFAEELERAQVPNTTRASNVGTNQASENATVILPAAIQTENVVPQPTSSAEYIVGEVKKHKRSVVLVGALILLALVGVGLWFFFLRSSNDKAPLDSIAVLPFKNSSTDADTEYLSDGLTESLIYRLSQLPNLKVSPTSSVFRYKGKETDSIKIGNELGVDAVMSGRIVQRGENLTISVELVDVRNNKLLWGEQYERRMSELLTTQREIAAEITNKLKLKLSGAETKGLTKRYTDNNEAYQLYLKGRFYLNKRDETNLRKAIEQFKAAVEKDPNYALALVGLADSYVLLPYYSSVSSTEVLPQAKGYAVRALEIDDSLGEAHASLGYVHRLLWNWDEMEKELKRAIELNPNYATAHKYYGNYLGNLGRFDEALAEYKRAQELDPLSLIISANVAEVYLTKGDLNTAVEQCRRTIDLDPNWYYVRLLLALVYLKQGLNAEALAEAEKSVELSKRQSAPLGVLGYIHAQTGKRIEAAAVVQELEARHAQRQANGYDLARVFVGLGDKDQAFAWLEKDFQSHNATMPGFLYMAPLDSLRDDSRFKDLSRRMGLPELK